MQVYGTGVLSSTDYLEAIVILDNGQLDQGHMVSMNLSLILVDKSQWYAERCMLNFKLEGHGASFSG